MGITNVDPIELDLYFERFINPNRSSPPDFDIDFSWKDREDVTRYIFERYRHTALMGTYVRFKERAVARELGKVFGLPKENIDKLLSLIVALFTLANGLAIKEMDTEFKNGKMVPDMTVSYKYNLFK